MAGMGGAGSNPGAPKPGGDGGRMRNTMGNLLSKYKVDYSNPGGAAALPSLDAAQTQQYYSQLQGAYSSYGQTIAGLRAQRIGIHKDLGATISGLKGTRIQGAVQNQGNEISGGMLGSTQDITNRTGLAATYAQGKASAQESALQALQTNTMAGESAGQTLFQAVTQDNAQALGEKEAALQNQLQNNLIVSGQETQMNILKAMYQAQLAATSGQSPVGKGLTPIPGLALGKVTNAKTLQNYLGGP